MTLQDFISEFVIIYNAFISSLPNSLQSFVNLFVLVFLIIIYSIFIWKLHKFIAKKNIFKFDLNQYNTSQHPIVAKLAASGFYLLEYIIIIPFLIFFWYAVFSIFLIFVMELDLKVILLISAAIIATVRITSYIPRYGETLAKEIAKLLPFNLLAIALLTPDFFNVERIISNLSKIDEFFSVILSYLAFVIILEVVLRLFEFVLGIMGIDDEAIKEKEKEE